jgi:hypothetical protein
MALKLDWSGRLVAFAGGSILLLAAMTAHAQSGSQADAAKREAQIAQSIQAAQAKPTPRDGNGHPQLSGYWTRVGRGTFDFGKPSKPQGGKVIETHMPPPQQVNVLEVERAKQTLAATQNRPKYKSAADQAKAKDYFLHAALNDPAYGCGAPGVARLGPPTEVAMTPTAAYFLYKAGVSPNQIRVIPTDGRGHAADMDAFPDGDSVGHWEGDTLVIDTVNIDPDTWLDGDGSFHSKELHVTERLRRQGDSLIYDIHLEDPLFAAPFDKPTQIALAGEPGQHLEEAYPCDERSQQHMVKDITRLDTGLPDQPNAPTPSK